MLPVALLRAGLNGSIAVLRLSATESIGLKVRGRAAGWVAACTNAGGRAAQAVALAGFVANIRQAATAILAPTALLLVIALRFCREPHGRDLRAYGR